MYPGPGDPSPKSCQIMSLSTAAALKTGGNDDRCASGLQFIGVFQFTSIVSKIGMNPRRSGSFVPLVSAFDLAPIDSYFLKEGDIIVRG
jgi:hypothetical protein